MSDKRDSEPTTSPATPIALRAKRSASGEHVIITREQLADLQIGAYEFAAVLRRLTDVEERLDRLTARLDARPIARLESVCLDGGDPRVEP
jgi:hypothetical protein